MKKNRLIALICLTLSMVFAFTLSACLGGKDNSNENSGNNNAPANSEIHAIYNTYVAYAEENNISPLSYEEWLEEIKGAAGEKGDPGEKGAGIESVTVDSQGRLVIMLTDGSFLPPVTIPDLEDETQLNIEIIDFEILNTQLNDDGKYETDCRQVDIAVAVKNPERAIFKDVIVSSPSFENDICLFQGGDLFEICVEVETIFYEDEWCTIIYFDNVPLALDGNDEFNLTIKEMTFITGGAIEVLTAQDNEEFNISIVYKVEDGIDKTKTQLYVANYNGGVGEIWLDNASERFEQAYANTSFEEGKTGVQVIISHDRIYGAQALVNTVKNDPNHVFFSGGMPYAEWVINGNMKDITHLVKDVRNESDGKTIFEKFYEEDKETLTVNGKIYGIPHYGLYQGITYDAGLFRDEKLFFGETIDTDGTRKFINTSDAKKSCGPDGIYDTYDDGLPSSVKEFEKLLDEMVKVGVIPFVYQPGHYTNMVPLTLYQNLLGADGIRALYTFDSNGKEFDIVESFNSDGTINTYKAAITKENGYVLKDSVALYQAIELSTKIFGEERYNHRDSQSSTFDRLQAMEALMFSGLDGRQPVAMLIEGNYWYNEAIDAQIIESLLQVYPEIFQLKDPKFMSLPRQYEGTVKEGEGSAPVMVDGGMCYCIVNPNAEDSDMPLIEKFISFLYSDEELEEFTRITNGVTRSIQYDYMETYEDLPTFAKSVMDMRLAADKANTFVKSEPRTDIGKMNYMDFSLSSTSFFLYNGNYTTVWAAAKQGKSAKDIFNDLRIGQDKWNSDFNNLG